MELKPGSRWKSAVCDGEMVVVRPPTAAGTLACGGHAVVALGEGAEALPIVDGHDGGLLMGKRYVDADSGIEVLGSKPGKGALSYDGRPMVLKDAKPLPASD
jgi:hypothetical protein